MIARDAITGIILSGGDARRMGGEEKGLAPLGDLPLVGHVRQRLVPQVGRIVFSANRHVERYGGWGDDVVTDVIPGRGPLGGLVSALARVETPWAFCCPGDAPLLAPTLVARLAAALGPGDEADLVMPHDGERLQPLFLVLRTTLRDPLADYLAEGGRSVLGWTDTRRGRVVDAADLHATFLNVNTVEVRQRVAALLATAEARG